MFSFTRPVAIFCLAASVSAYAQDFKKQVIYQIVTDRFVNGDTSNDNPPQSAGLFDPTQTRGRRTGAVTWPAFSRSWPTSKGWARRPSGFRRPSTTRT